MERIDKVIRDGMEPYRAMAEYIVDRECPNEDIRAGYKLREEYQDGLKLIMRRLSYVEEKALTLRFGLSGDKPMSERRVARRLSMDHKSTHETIGEALEKLGRPRAMFFYVLPPGEYVPPINFGDVLGYLRSSNFSVDVMYLIALAGISTPDGLQTLVYMCPELFDIFRYAGCKNLVEMGCEDPRDVPVLSSYHFDNCVRIEFLNFTTETYTVLKYENHIERIGHLTKLRYADLVELKNVRQIVVEEICDKLHKMGFRDPRTDETYRPDLVVGRHCNGVFA